MVFCAFWADITLFLNILDLLSFPSWHNAEWWKREGKHLWLLVLPWLHLVHCITNKLLYWCHCIELVLFEYQSINIKHDHGYWFQLVWAIHIQIAVYFKTICNWIFHKPTLSIPVSLLHFLCLFRSLLSLTRFPQAANHRIHCNTCNYFLTINCYLATGSLERVGENERQKEKICVVCLVLVWVQERINIWYRNRQYRYEHPHACPWTRETTFKEEKRESARAQIYTEDSEFNPFRTAEYTQLDPLCVLQSMAVDKKRPNIDGRASFWVLIVRKLQPFSQRHHSRRNALTQGYNFHRLILLVFHE